MSDHNLVTGQNRGEEYYWSQVSAALDAFGRQRISSPVTLFDSKLSTANHTIFWDDQETSGSGTSSTYSKNRASYTMTVGATTAGTRIRQSKQRFNYQPGKSQLVALTAVIGAQATGITRRIGYMDDENGLFFEIDATAIKVVKRSYVTGSAVDTLVTQTDWEYDPMDGSGPTEVDLDTEKAVILVIDFESLQVGTVRFGVYVDGVLVYVHAMDHANLIDSAYFSTPNLPVRYEISNDGTGPQSTLEQICCTVISEGGSQDTGVTRYEPTTRTKVDADVAGTTYAITGIRLKSTALDSVVKIVKAHLYAATQDDFEWFLILNPTVAGTFAYSDVGDSAVQIATGATANTITGGTYVAGGFSTSSSVVDQLVDSLYYLGSAIDGTRDEIVLAANPFSNQADLYGTITFKEIA